MDAADRVADWLQNLETLDPATPPLPGIPLQRWRWFVIDAKAFCASPWAEVAAAEGLARPNFKPIFKPTGFRSQ